MPRRAYYDTFGAPQDVIQIVEDEREAMGAHDVLLGMEAACLHIADIYRVTGVRPFSGPSPGGIPGAEGVGRVLAVGSDVSRFAVGDRAIPPLSFGTCRDEIKIVETDLIKVRQDGDALQLAMATVNPVTSWLLINAFVEHKPGDWIVQNGGNSACGRYAIELARTMGLRTVSAVRRDEMIKELKAIGADAVVMDGPGLHERVAAATGGADIKLALDVAGGQGTAWIAHCLGELGLIVNYGLMSGEDPVIPKELSLGRGLRFQGFMMSRTFKTLYGPERERAVREEVADLVGKGALTAKVAAVYPLERVADALDHANRRGAARDGKILITCAHFSG
ncbi:MAG: zinc-dependent alcohol dehydrogenase family protein [Alphaproteobacteria bacterium]